MEVQEEGGVEGCGGAWERSASSGCPEGGGGRARLGADAGGGSTASREGTVLAVWVVVLSCRPIACVGSTWLFRCLFPTSRVSPTASSDVVRATLVGSSYCASLCGMGWVVSAEVA